MKDVVINNLIEVIKNNVNHDEVKLKEIKYGLESFYLTVTKTIVIFTVSYFLGTLKTLLLFMLAYGLLRLTGFGLHAKKSWHCWISSGIIFLLIPYLCMYLHFTVIFQMIISAVCVILLGLYAPADTEKRPIVSKKRRSVYKIVCVCTAIIYLVTIYFLDNYYYENILMFALVLQTALVLPISYKIFGLKYDNYKDYLKYHS